MVKIKKEEVKEGGVLGREGSGVDGGGNRGNR
jgi:hypothetical protein